MFVQKKDTKTKGNSAGKGASPWDSLISIFMLALLMMCLSLPSSPPLSVLPSVLFIFCTSHLLCRRFTPKLS